MHAHGCWGAVETTVTDIKQKPALDYRGTLLGVCNENASVRTRRAQRGWTDPSASTSTREASIGGLGNVKEVEDSFDIYAEQRIVRET